MQQLLLTLDFRLNSSIGITLSILLAGTRHLSWKGLVALRGVWGKNYEIIWEFSPNGRPQPPFWEPLKFLGGG